MVNSHRDIPEHFCNCLPCILVEQSKFVDAEWWEPLLVITVIVKQEGKARMIYVVKVKTRRRLYEVVFILTDIDG